MAEIREPARAGSFYPGTGAACAREIEALRAQEPDVPADLRGAEILGGIVPHAGWRYSGATALAVFDALKHSARPPETVIVFATAHRPDVAAPSVQSAGRWRVPGGEVELDAELAAAMLAEAGPRLLTERARAHEGDHAIEVQLPLLLDALPGARLVPVACPHGVDGAALGQAAARAVERLGRNAVALASTDLTHYGSEYYGFDPMGAGPEAHRWSKEVNDGAFLERVLALDAEGAAERGEADRSACGPQAAAAAIAFAQARGATEGVLLEHVTSWERDPERGAPRNFVGYAAVVFVRKG